MRSCSELAPCGSGEPDTLLDTLDWAVSEGPATKLLRCVQHYACAPSLLTNNECRPTCWQHESWQLLAAHRPEQTTRRAACLMHTAVCMPTHPAGMLVQCVDVQCVRCVHACSSAVAKTPQKRGDKGFSTCYARRAVQNPEAATHAISGEDLACRARPRQAYLQLTLALESAGTTQCVARTDCQAAGSYATPDSWHLPCVWH